MKSGKRLEMKIKDKFNTIFFKVFRVGVKLIKINLWKNDKSFTKKLEFKK